MLSAVHFFAFAEQLPLLQAGQLLLVTGLAFALITLTCSIVRFHKLIQLGEEDLQSTEQCDDFFFIQVTRYLSKVNRVSNGFGIVIAQIQTDGTALRPAQEKLFRRLQALVRNDLDKACLFHEDCVAALIDTDIDNVNALAQRVAEDIQNAAADIPEITAVRAGAANFPTHGLSTQQLIDVTTDAVESADFDAAIPLCIAPVPEDDDGLGETEEIGELSKQDKKSTLDPLTGVLKAEVIGSYMRKYLSDIRQKKGPAAALCVRIDRINNIIKLHGEEAGDAAIAGTSAVFQRLTRDSDLIGRFGRDDFLILAPCTLAQGELIANRLKDAVSKEVILFEGKRLKTAVSIGISGHPEHGRALRHLFRASYAALEVIADWDTSTCLVYDPDQHSRKKKHDKPVATRH